MTLQLGIGFALTVLSIWAMPILAGWLGSWRWTFIFLVPGPLIGAVSMAALRRRPEAVKLAGGAR